MNTDMKKYYRKPALTVDGIIIYNDKLLLIRRKNPPFKDMLALPGGFVNYGEKVEDAVVREIKEETGLNTVIKKLVGVYSEPGRDPRGHTVSIVYLLEVVGGKPKSSTDAKSIELINLSEIPTLAFDHNKIVRDAFRCVK